MLLQCLRATFDYRFIRLKLQTDLDVSNFFQPVNWNLHIKIYL